MTHFSCTFFHILLWHIFAPDLLVPAAVASYCSTGSANCAEVLQNKVLWGDHSLATWAGSLAWYGYAHSLAMWGRSLPLREHVKKLHTVRVLHELFFILYLEQSKRRALTSLGIVLSIALTLGVGQVSIALIQELWFRVTVARLGWVENVWWHIIT